MRIISRKRPAVKPGRDGPSPGVVCTPEDVAEAVRAFEEQRERERVIRMRWAFAEQEAVRRIAAGWRW